MVEWLSVSDEWLGTRNGIAGYNKMMLSYDFYQLFRDSEYVLIYQTDAWVFQDNLAEWCSKGYDYVAAPWIKRAVYDYPFIKQYMACLRAYRARKHQFCRQRIYGKVGNGGLSLRKVSSSEACLLYKCEIGKYLSHRKHYYNEDVFFGLLNLVSFVIQQRMRRWDFRLTAIRIFASSVQEELFLLVVIVGVRAWYV